MEPATLARRRHQGGDIIPTPSPTRRRLRLRLLSVATLIAAAAWSITLAPKVLPITSALDAVATVVLAVALRRRSEQLVGPAVALALAAYVLAVVASRRTFDEGAAFVGAALLMSGEFAALSIHDSSRIRIDVAVVRARIAAIVYLVIAGFILATVIASTVSVPLPRSAYWTTAGGTLLLLIVGLLTALDTQLIRRRRHGSIE